MIRVGRYFVAALLAFGVVAGVAIAKVPALEAVPVPALTLPLIASLLADLVLMRLARAGRIAPLTMEERGIGVLGSALVALGGAAWLKGGGLAASCLALALRRAQPPRDGGRKP